jgi:hypothetical protein
MGDFVYRPGWKRSKGIIFFLSIVETYFPFSRYFSFGLLNSIDSVLHTITSDEKCFSLSALRRTSPFSKFGLYFF